MNNIVIIDRSSRWEGSSTSDKILDSLIDDLLDRYIKEETTESNSNVWHNESLEVLNKWVDDLVNEVLEDINKPIHVSVGKKRSRTTSDTVAGNTRAAKKIRLNTVAGNTRAAKKRL